MTAQNNSIKIHQLRLTLLHNDYNVLPTKDKGCYIRGWSTVDTTAEFLEQHKRRADYSSTGLRCDRLIAIDIDITDEALAERADAMTEGALGRSSFCRIGRWPKRLLLYRLAEDEQAGRSARTGKYGGHQIELLCGKGRQFIAYGTHPKTGEPYYWTDDHGRDCGPREHVWRELPAVTMEQAYKLMATLDGWLGSLGLPLESKGGQRGVSGGIESDLTDDFEFQPVGAEPIRWAELREQLTTTGVFGNIRRENGEFGDSDAVHAYLATGSGQPTIHDFARDVTHCEAVGGAHLEQALPPPPPADQAGGTFTDDILTRFLGEYVLFGDEVRRVAHPDRVYKLSAFKNLHKQHMLTVPGKSGKPTVKPLVEIWQQHPQVLTADYAEMRPDHPHSYFIRNGAETIFNTYRPPEHAIDGGEIDTALEFITHLVPKKHERELFLDWLAYKIAHPAVRMHALIMVAASYGTGRGTMAKILHALLGDRYVTDVDLSELIGKGSQAQFNEYLAASLLVTVSEALEDKNEAMEWKSRHAAFEQLKRVCEPNARRMRIKTKYGAIRSEMVYASVYIATNHANALAIPHGDRRLIVIDNTRTPLVKAPADLARRIYDWLEARANIAAFYRYLLARADRVQYNPYGEPPMTAAKERMIELNQSDADQLFGMFVETAAGDVATASQWRQFAIATERKYDDISLPENIEHRDRALKAVWESNTQRCDNLPDCGIKIGDKPVRPRTIRNHEKWSDLAGGKSRVYRAHLRAEVEKNGPIGGNVLQFK